jgi:RNA polymerase sigma factor (sigma-70 family)
MDRFTFDDLYVRRLKEHDRETEDHFAKYFGSVLLAKLHGRIPPQEIGDFIHDVLVRVLSKIGDLREDVKLGAFVLGFCENRLLEWYRQKSWTESLEERHLTIRGKVDLEEELLRKEAAAVVRQILSDMGDGRDAEILRAIFLHDVDRDEVCRRFDVSAKNLSVILHRAKEKFRAAFRKNKR